MNSLGDFLLNLLVIFQDTFKILLGFFFALLAFNYQEEYKERKERRRNSFAFLMEIHRNLLACTMMKTMEDFELFESKNWYKFSNYGNFEIKKEVFIYTFLLELTNRIIADFIQFKTFYTSDSKNRTSENEKTLEAKRVRVIESLNTFEQTIIKAADSYKKELSELKILRNS
jgi:hypothetical protein